MTNTENLYERIAEQEGYEYRPDNFPLVFVPKESPCIPVSINDFCFMLVKRHDLQVGRACNSDPKTGETIWLDYYDVERYTPKAAWIEDKNLENAVMLAALSISEGE